MHFSNSLIKYAIFRTLELFELYGILKSLWYVRLSTLIKNQNHSSLSKHSGFRVLLANKKKQNCFAVLFVPSPIFLRNPASIVMPQFAIHRQFKINMHERTRNMKFAIYL